MNMINNMNCYPCLYSPTIRFNLLWNFQIFPSKEKRGYLELYFHRVLLKSISKLATEFEIASSSYPFLWTTDLCSTNIQLKWIEFLAGEKRDISNLIGFQTIRQRILQKFRKLQSKAGFIPFLNNHLLNIYVVSKALS